MGNVGGYLGSANGLWLQAHYSHAIEFVNGVAELFLHIADAICFNWCQPLY